MPPKREPSVSNNNNGNNVSSNEALATPSSTNNVTTTALPSITTTTTITATSVAGTTTTTTAMNSNNNNGSSPITANGNGLPIAIADVAAEQRIVAYQANAKLCRLVRKCPWMYDRNHINYAKKHILDKSWCKIARECNDSVASCKERWRNIRAAFARSINIYKTHSGPNRVKPYYLYNELSFLVKPMMESRDRRDEYDDAHEGSSIGADGGGGGIKYEDNGRDEDPNEEGEYEEEEAGYEEDEFCDETVDIKSAFAALNPDIRIQTDTRHQKTLGSNHKNHNNNNSNMNININKNNNDFELGNIFESQTEFNANSDAENDFSFSDENMSQTEAERERKMAQMMQQTAAIKRPMHFETETFDAKRLKLMQSNSNSSNTTNNENDIRFLEALLPDMALMNTRQKVVFKRKIYQTLEEVFENSNDFPNVEQNKVENQMMVASTNPNSLAHPQSNLNYSTNNYNGHQTQVRQTILTVNSSTARSLINNIANLNESELQKVNGFLQSLMRNHSSTTRLNSNNNIGPSSAAAKLMSSTPKITITKVTCPPPASLRNLALNKPPSPSPATVSTTIQNPSALVISSNVHSTTSSNPAKPSTTQNGNSLSYNNSNTSPWSQLLPITIKDEIEDVDIV